MKDGIKFVIGIAILAVIIGGATILYNSVSDEYSVDRLAGQQSTGEEQSNSSPAPDFTVTDKDGSKVKLSDMKGKPVVLNFWASWCPPCKAEMPDFEQMYKKYGNEINFMIVNSTDGQQETVETAKAYIEQNGYTFPVYYDTMYEGAYAYQVHSLPSTFFIDASGNVVTYAMGALDGATLEKGIGMIKQEEQND